MRKDFLFLIGLGLWPTGFSFAEEANTVSCETLGYRVDQGDCADVGTPLLCPFYTLEKKKTVCLIKSCRGYPLSEEDFDKPASDGRPMREHLDGGFVPKKEEAGGAEGCRAGWDVGDDGNLKELWYYRVKQCKEGSLYQNGICDVGCDRVYKYPYSSHPGNMAGSVESCVDKDGEWFGYTSCNDGWEKNDGRCELAECSLEKYPYTSDPNFEEYRGTLSTCKIGGSTYYRYEACASGFTQAGGVCAKTCNVNVNGCRRTEKQVSYTENGTTYVRKYNAWDCDLQTSKCRIGDYAAINGKIAGVIFHFPDAVIGRTLIVAQSGWRWLAWGLNAAANFDTPLDRWTNDIDGRYNTNVLMNLKQLGSAYSFPMAEYCQAYVPANGACSSGTNFCSAGEWYLATFSEMKLMYENRYILYHVNGDSAFLSGNKGTSTESSATYYVLYYWTNGGSWGTNKSLLTNFIPVASF